MKVSKFKGIVFNLYFQDESEDAKSDFYSLTVIAKSAEEAILKAKAVHPNRTVSSIFSERGLGRGPLKPEDIYY